MTTDTATAKQLADALGVSVQAVHKRAKGERWAFTSANGRGDKVFKVDRLPGDVRARWIQHVDGAYIKGLVLPTRGDVDLTQARALLAKFEGAPEWARARAEARGAIVDAFDRAAAAGEKKNLTKAKKEFVRRYNAGNNHLGLDTGVYETIDRVSRASLDRWRGLKRRLGLAGLLDGSRERESFSGLTEDMKDYIKGLKKKKIHTRPVRICEYLANKFAGEPLPSDDTVRRYLHDWEEKNASLVAYLINPDKWRDDYQIAFGDSSSKAQYFLHMIEFDNTPADLMCADGRRHTVVGAIDVFSRKVKCLVVPTSKSQAIATLMRRIIVEWGLFDVMIKDNGSDYASKHIDACCGALGLETPYVPPFTPEAKPHIERFFRTLSTGLFEELAGYVGHSVAERKDIEAQKSFADRIMHRGAVVDVGMSAAELQGMIDTWTENIYHQRVHGSLGMSPEAKAGESSQPVRKIMDERVLDILLAPAGKPTVQKKGIRFQHGHYVAPELGDHIGEKVQLRQDLADAGRVYVFTLDGAFICTAEDAALGGMTVEEVNRARKHQKKAVLEQARALETLAKGVGDPMAELLESKRGGAGKVARFSRREAFESDAVREAARALCGPELVETFAVERDGRDAVPYGEEKQTPKKVVPLRDEVPLFNTVLDRYKYLVAQKKIRVLNEREVGFMENYEATEEHFRIFVMPYQEKEDCL